jgi:Zn-dependent peptidase ImmA (M78 family)
MPDFRRAQREALSLLSDFGINEPPVNPVRIARDLGINVVFADFAEHSREVSGFYDFDENAIFVNSDEFPQRQTFTIAHELGHKRLHEEWVRSSDYRVLLRDSGPTGPTDDEKEREANVFAAHLLVPRFLLDRYRNVATVQELAQLFLVSAPVIKNRMKFEYGS